ncbi:MAG: hypothetical protein JSU57_06050 [Candidatus Heimdallarchaeota archaeon]|nr:MAG: hypothetical protein JSU57_06050 [Candidatus Heimdallarchaeota archaeon]
MRTDPIHKDEVIKQLVSQQYFIQPNLITDRTYRLKIEIRGSERVFDQFSDFLYKISNDLKGIDPTPYNIVLEKAGETLQLKSEAVQQRFYDKTHAFLREGLATEDILFITAISSVLEVLDVHHFEELIEQLHDSYVQLCIHKTPNGNDSNLLNHFNAGIKRLGEIADAHFSLLLNIVKCVKLAQLFNIELNFDQVLVREYHQSVVHKIISGGI